MRAARRCLRYSALAFPPLAAIAGIIIPVSIASAQCGHYPPPPAAVASCLPCAPDACHGGFYTICPNLAVYGPNYDVRPPWPPFQMPLPGPIGEFIMNGRGQCGYPSGYGYGPPPRPNYGPGPRSPGLAPVQPLPHGPNPYGAGPQGPFGAAPLGAAPFGAGPPSGAPLGPGPFANGGPGPGFPPNFNLPTINPQLPRLGFQPPPAKPDEPVFHYNPYVRSPRDFFMNNEVVEDRLERERRPVLNP